MKMVICDVHGVAPVDRNFFGARIQNYLARHENIDLRIEWFGGESGTGDVRVVIDCCEFTFPRTRAGIVTALQSTYLANPLIVPKHDPAKAVAVAA